MARTMNIIHIYLISFKTYIEKNINCNLSKNNTHIDMNIILSNLIFINNMERETNYIYSYILKKTVILNYNSL